MAEMEDGGGEVRSTRNKVTNVFAMRNVIPRRCEHAVDDADFSFNTTFFGFKISKKASDIVTANHLYTTIVKAIDKGVGAVCYLSHKTSVKSRIMITKFRSDVYAGTTGIKVAAATNASCNTTDII